MGRIEKLITRWSIRFGLLVVSLPHFVQRVLAGPRPKKSRELHVEAWMLSRLSLIPEFFDRFNSMAKSVDRLDIEADVFGGTFGRDVDTSNTTLPGPAGDLPARLFTPPGAPAVGPLLVYFHGGGWVSGSIDSHDPLCRALAELAGVRVISVGYRLAPEHPFPAAADDADAAYEHVARNAERYGADPARLAVGGDSAGGNLAAVVALGARGADYPAPAFQLLLYPATDLSRSCESHRIYDRGYFLTSRVTKRFVDAYAPDETMRDDPRASVLRADDLQGLPPAYLASAHADALRDEGERYGERLREAGVDVEIERFPLLHGFANMGATRSGAAAVETIAAALKRGLA